MVLFHLFFFFYIDRYIVSLLYSMQQARYNVSGSKIFWIDTMYLDSQNFLDRYIVAIPRQYRYKVSLRKQFSIAFRYVFDRVSILFRKLFC